MTMNELHTLYEQYFPSAPPHHEQGRAGVTVRAGVTPGAPVVTHYWWEREHLCSCGCGRKFWGGGLKKYLNDAHKQRAYRQRKKAGK